MSNSSESELRLQDPGEGIHEAEIVEILVSVGDSVEDGDTVLVVETDKATSEVASPTAGEVASIHVEVGQMVEVGDILIRFGPGDQDASDSKSAAEGRPSGDALGEEPSVQEGERSTGVDTTAQAPEPSEMPEAPGSGHTDDDASPETTENGGRRPVAASPATRQLARELGVDLTTVEATGDHDRVTLADVRRAAESADAGEDTDTDSTEATRTEADRTAGAERESSEWGPVDRQPLRGVRRAIAEQMEASWTPIPRVTHHDEADITELERFRRRHTERVAASGGSLGLLVLVAKATAAALGQHPRFNASLDGDSIVVKQYVHIGIATDTEDGLLVPVLRNVDTKSIEDLTRELPMLLERTRKRDLDRREMQGASFTITNVGPLGGRFFTPMVNSPQVAILGTAKARIEHRVSGDIDDDPADLVAEPRLILPLSLSFDHRVNDGADAARFTKTIADLLGDPERLALAI